MSQVVQITSQNYEGQVALVTFYPCTGGTISLGYVTIPYNYEADYYLGTYTLYFSGYNETCEFSIPCPTPTQTPTKTPTPTRTNPRVTQSITPTKTPTPTTTSSCFCYKFINKSLNNGIIQYYNCDNKFTQTTSQASSTISFCVQLSAFTASSFVTVVQSGPCSGGSCITPTPTPTKTATPTKTPTNTPTKTVTPTNCCLNFELFGGFSGSSVFNVTFCNFITGQVTVNQNTLYSQQYGSELCAFNVSVFSGSGFIVYKGGCGCTNPTPTPTPTQTKTPTPTILPPINICDVLYVTSESEVFSYNPDTNTSTNLTGFFLGSESIEGYNYDIAHTEDTLWLMKSGRIQEWYIQLTPFNAQFSRYIDLPTSNNGDGLGVINNTRLIITRFSDVPNIPNEIIQLNISGPNPIAQIIQYLPIGRFVAGDISYNAEGKLLITNGDSVGNTFITQYDYDTLALEVDVNISNTIDSPEGLFYSNEIYVVEGGSDGQTYSIQNVYPYSLSGSSQIGQKIRGLSQITECFRESFRLPPLLSPTPTPTLTPTTTPTQTPTKTINFTPTTTPTPTLTPTNCTTEIITIPATPPTNITEIALFISPQHDVYTLSGTLFHDPFNLNGTSPGGIYAAVKTNATVWRSTSYLNGPLNRTGIWSTDPDNFPINTWLGFSVCINAPSTKTYWVGLGGDNNFRFVVDGVDFVNTYNGPYDGEYDDGSNISFIYWHVYPVNLTAGNHVIELYGLNRDTDTAAIFGCEIYDNTFNELTGATSVSNLNIIFSSSGQTSATTVQNLQGVYLEDGWSCPTGYIFDPCNYTCYREISSCITPTPTSTTTKTPTLTPTKTPTQTSTRINLSSTPTPTVTPTPNPQCIDCGISGNSFTSDVDICGIIVYSECFSVQGGPAVGSITVYHSGYFNNRPYYLFSDVLQGVNFSYMIYWDDATNLWTVKNMTTNQIGATLNSDIFYPVGPTDEWVFVSGPGTGCLNPNSTGFYTAGLSCIPCISFSGQGFCNITQTSYNGIVNGKYSYSFTITNNLVTTTGTTYWDGSYLSGSWILETQVYGICSYLNINSDLPIGTSSQWTNYPGAESCFCFSDSSAFGTFETTCE